MILKPFVPWYRRWWVVLIGVLLFILLGIYGLKVYQEWRIDQELSKEIELLDRNDPQWRFEDWVARQQLLKDDENLALIALQFKPPFNMNPNSYDRLFAEVETFPSHRLNQDQIEELNVQLTVSRDLATKLDQLLRLRTGAFPMKDPRDPNYKILAAQLGRQQEMRSVANLFRYYALQQIEENHSEAAIKACEASLQLAHTFEKDPFITSQLVRIAIESFSISMVERTLAQCQLPVEALTRLQSKLLEEADDSFFKTSARGERAGVDRFLREVEEGRYSPSEMSQFSNSILQLKKGTTSRFNLRNMLQGIRTWMSNTPFNYIPEERIKAIRFYNDALALVDQPGGVSLDDMKAFCVQKSSESDAVAYFGAALARVHEADEKRRATLRMTAALLAAEHYRLDTGKAPTGWNDLVPKYFPSVPKDPYDGKLIRWKNTPTGFMLYSVWIDKVDDGGVIHRASNGSSMTDFGVEYFNPAHRRAAPVPTFEEKFSTPDTKEQFFAAARAGKADKLKELLEAGFDVNTKTEYGATALCFAAEFGHLDVVQLLIDKKIDVNARDTFYHADALTWAMMKDRDEIMVLLLKAGAKGEAGALSHAISQNKPKLVAAILATGRIKQETLDSSMSSIDGKKKEIVKLLADAGAKGEPKVAKAEEKKAASTPAKTEEATITTTSVVEPTARVEKPLPWAGFRGMNNAGLADGQFPPTAWDATTGKNLAWKTPIPGLGLSCPVVWDNRLFLTTAVNMDSPKPSLRIGQYGDVDSVKETAPHTWLTYCLDVDTGKILWQKQACKGVPKVKRHMKSSHANATPSTNGQYVVVNFGSEGLYCYTIEGKLIWQKQLGKLGSGWFFNPDYEWGFGSSPVIFADLVIVQCDIGKNSFIAAYALSNGAELWSTPREEIPSWCSPTIVQPENGKSELITVASKYARGYDPFTGKELWKLGKFSEIAVPTPFYAQGLIYLTTGYAPIQPIYAVKPGAHGDISLEKGKETNDSIAWSKARGGPYLPTPLVYGEHLYVCSNSGVFSCYEAKTGKVIYQKRLGGKNGYTASLVAADGRIYCTDEEGVVRVVKAGPEFQLLAINKLGEECLSHPAISNGRIYFRGREHVMAFAVAPVKQ